MDIAALQFDLLLYILFIMLVLVCVNVLLLLLALTDANCNMQQVIIILIFKTGFKILRLNRCKFKHRFVVLIWAKNIVV